MLAIAFLRSLVRPALRSAALVLALAAPAVAQNISVTSGTATVPGTFASGTYVDVNVTGTSTLDVSAPLTATGFVDIDDFSTLNVNANFTLDPGVQAVIYNGATLSLQSGTFGGAGSELYLSEGGFQRTGGHYAVNFFSIGSGSANFVAGDSIAKGLAVYDSEFTLESNLTLTGTDSFEGLYLSGTTTVLNRTNGALITAQVLSAEFGAFTTDPGDNFTGAQVLATSGGTIVNTGSQSLRSVEVNGYGVSNPTFTTTAPITVGDGDPDTDDIRVLEGGTFVADADVTAGSVLVGVGGTYNLASGTSTATSLVVRSGTLTRVAGNYQVDLVDLGAATMDFQPGDSVDSLTLTGSSVFATGSSSLAALELQDLTIEIGSLLALGNLDGVDGQVTGWGLKVATNVEAILLDYIASGRIVSLDSTPLSVLYNATSNATYVTAVPEPSTLALAAASGLLAGWRTLRRRRVAG